MRSRIVLGIAGLLAAGLYFVLAASWDQLAYCKAALVSDVRGAMVLRSKPIQVRLDAGGSHFVDVGAMLAYFDRIPGWRSHLILLCLSALVCGGLVACMIGAAFPALLRRRDGRESHRRGALMDSMAPALFRGDLRQAWAVGAGLSLVAWLSLHAIVDAQAAAVPTVLLSDVPLQTLRAVGCGYGLAFAGALIRFRRKPEAVSLHLGHVPIPRPAELFHILVAGRTGAGKTQAIQQLLRPVRARGDRGLVADPDGGYLARFGRESDRLLNPFDRRGLRWSPFAEIRAAFDYDVLANAVIPQGNTANEEEWRRFGRVLLAATLRKLHEDGRGSAREVLHMINAASDEDLRKMLADTNAAGLRRHDAMFHSILGVVTPHIQSWEHLVEPDAGHPAFSVRDWVREGADWLFMPYRDDQLEALKYLMATWTALAVAEALSLPEDLGRRFWFVIDELDSLGKVASLRLAATKLRKHGGVMVAGLQTVAQLRSTYGQDEAQVLLSSLSNKLILAMGDHETAKYFQEELGQHEIERRRVSRQFGRSSGKPTGSTTVTSEIVVEHLVLASQLQGLKERRGYLRRAGDDQVHPVQIPLVPMPARLPAFIPAR